MSAYYNEIDPYAAQWLRNLIASGYIASGDVDERSIVDLQPNDLCGYTQCHFFAGIGGWSYALRLAGWPDDRPVWTGSCPCQPFSAAGKQRGSDDERHLWPAFFRLIRECRPRVVFGEQVAGSAGYAWWDHVATDLESEGYAAAAADIGAHSVGAPHLRQRLYWMADAGHAAKERQRKHSGQVLREQETEGFGGCGGMGDSSSARLAKQRSNARISRPPRDGGSGKAFERADTSTAWSDLQWLPCSDGKVRPTQPGLFPLAHGLSNRVGRLRAYGNAIVPQVAAEFIRAAA